MQRIPSSIQFPRFWFFTLPLFLVCCANSWADFAPRPVPGRILVKFKPTASQGSSLSGRAGVARAGSVNQEVTLVPIASDEKPEDAVQRLERDPAVEFAEVDMLVPPAYTPNDPSLSSQWHHDVIGSRAAWEYVQGTGVTIAIADSGVDASHPEFSGRMVSGWNFFDNNNNTSDVYGHGTNVAGAALAAGDNNLQGAGVAYKARVMPLRISDTAGWATYSAAAQAIRWAKDHGARVINISFQMGQSLTVAAAASEFRAAGGLVVIAAGNSGVDSGGSDVADIIVVSATGNNDVKASWSNFGAEVDLAAPGVGIVTTARGGGSTSQSGTSFSAPIVAGVLGLIFSANPSLTAIQARDFLFQSAHDVGASGKDPLYGYGRVDAQEAVRLARQSVAPLPPTIGTQPADQRTREGNAVTFTLTASGAAPLTVQWESARPGSTTFTDILGATSMTWSITPALSDDGLHVRAKVCNSVGSTTSNVAELRVLAAGPNTPPIVVLNAPLGSPSFTEGENVLFRATASDPEGFPLRVEFRIDGVPVGLVTTAPFEFTWSASGVGSHHLVVRVTDAEGGTTNTAEQELQITARPAPAAKILGFVNPMSARPINSVIQVIAENAERLSWKITPISGAGANSGSLNRVPGGANSAGTGVPVLALSEFNLSPGLYLVEVTAYNSAGVASPSIQAEFVLVQPDLEKVRVYPNPWRSDRAQGPIHFDNLTVNSEVKIFTIAGRHVRSLAAANNEVTWDLKNEEGSRVASGIYFYLIKSSSGEKTRGKIAIIQ